MGSPCLNNGVTLAIFHESGKYPADRQALISMDNGCAISDDTKRRTAGAISSWPGPLLMSRAWHNDSISDGVVGARKIELLHLGPK